MNRAFLFFLMISNTAFAQVILPGSHLSRKFQFEELKSDSNQNITHHPTIVGYDNGFQLLDPFTQTSFNSTYARSYNDGPVWKGKGLTQEIHAGFQWKKGLLKVNFYPVAYLSQNASYPLASINPSQNPYSYQFGVSGQDQIDYVQRYGNSSFANFHLGQSEIYLGNEKVRASISTQNFTLGPAVHNSIILSNTAPGFPHVMIGTPEKIELRFKDVELGNLEANIFYGLLKESDYFDSISDNNYQYLMGMSIGYEVPYLEGLTVGLNRVMYKNTQHFVPENLYGLFKKRSEGIGDSIFLGNDTFDQMASVFLQWKIPEYDLRLYFEFARNDFNGSKRRIITEFEHSRAYALGLAKIFQLQSGKELYMSYEHTFLPRYMSYQYRPSPGFYAHSINRQGYTNEGQILGAGVGPGAVSDIFELNRFNGSEQVGIFIQRIRFDEDYFITKVQPNDDSKIGRHDVEFTLGTNYSRQTGRWMWGFETKLSYRFNMYYEANNDKVNLYASAFASLLINQ